MAEETSNTIGQYELRSILGKGGMAAVWRAYQPSLDREVAIKVMAAQFSDDETFTKRFNQEARSIARLRHPNILAIYEYGQDKGQPYIVTELLDGGTLREYMRKPMDLKRTARIIHQIADALDYAHAQGMVHRDIKPTNILMDTQRVGGERAVLGDFGIVKLLESTNITQTGVGIGTPEYMSPEQAAGEPLDGRSDEYSLGIVLYEMLAGVTPYKADTPLAVMMGHVNKPLPDPRTFNPKISLEIIAVLTKALAKYPQERYESAGAFSEALEQAASVSGGTEGRTNTGTGGLTGTGTGAATQVYSGRPVGDSTNSLPNAALPHPTNGGGPMFTPPGTVPTTGRFNPNQTVISSAQAYDFALLQEEQGNSQAAFETLTDLYKREPSYRDVGTRLQQYQAKGLQYSGQHTIFRALPGPRTGDELTRSLPVGPYKSQTQQGQFIPQDSTGLRPLTPGPATRTETVSGPGVNQVGLAPVASKKTPVMLIGLIAGLVLVAIVAAVVVLVLLPKPTPPSTPQSLVSTVTSAPSTTAATTAPAVATTAPVVVATTATAATTPAVTTAAVSTAPTTTLAPTTPPGKADPAAIQAMGISNAIYKTDGNLVNGITALKALADKNPDSWVTQRELGKAYYWYMRDDGGVTYLKKAILLNPGDAMSNAYLALAYTGIFDDNNASGPISKARDLDPNSAEVLGAQAVTLLRTDVNQAKAKAEAALKIDSNSLLGNYARWASFVQTNEFDTALPFLDKLIKNYPKLAAFYTDKGYHYLRDSNSTEATKWYNMALAIDADFPTAHSGLCEIAYLQGDNNKAVDECSKAIKTYAYAVYGYVYLGYAYNNLGKSTEAEAALNKATKLDLKNSTAYNGLAFTYIDRAVNPANKDNKELIQNLLTQAVDKATQAIELDRSYADAYFNQGYAYSLMGKYSAATAPLVKATELRTDSANYFTVLAYNYLKLTDKGNARLAIDKALALEPNNEQAKAVLKAIQAIGG